MAIELNEIDDGKVLHLKLSGKLVKEDYVHFLPEVDRLIEKHGAINVLMEMHDFHGWSWGAMWADAKFAFRHFRGIKRIAMIGEQKWQKAMANFCKPFTKAEIRYYDPSCMEEARNWVLEHEPAMTE